MSNINTESELDYLTNLHNEKYLEKNYERYIKENHNSNLVMIDFEKFKSINDKYGHSIGDKYLKLFAIILKKVFIGSIIVRLHGDEFAILTHYTEKEIASKFLICDQLIDHAVDEQEIPIKFGYNAGSAKTETNIEITKEKADFMMYHAKNEQKKYQKFDEEIWNQKITERQYLSNIDIHLKNNIFSYTTRQLFDKEKQEQGIYLICTKDNAGESIFCDNQYDILRDNSKITQLDMHNIQYLLNNFSTSSNNVIINIDYKSLVSVDVFIEHLKELSKILTINFNNVILSINLNGVEFSNYHLVISNIDVLRSLGFQICLDKYDSKTSDEIWLNSEVDYIKISCSCWKEAMINPKLDYYLKSKVEMFTNYKEKSLPIFLCVENQSQHEYLSEFPTDGILLGGNYYSEEKRLILEHNKE